MKKCIVKAVVADAANKMRSLQKISVGSGRYDPTVTAAYNAWNTAITNCVEVMQRKFRKALNK